LRKESIFKFRIDIAIFRYPVKIIGYEKFFGKKISSGDIFMLVFIHLYQSHLQFGNNQKNGLQERRQLPRAPQSTEAPKTPKYV
jgi:hypothetical protein